MKQTIKKSSYIYQIISMQFSDESFMLACLRIAKYDIRKAIERNENYFLLTKKFPEYVSLKPEDVTKSLELLDAGVVVPLKMRDSQGRQIIVTSLRKLDTTKYSGADLHRLISMISIMLQCDEITTLAGFVQIVDGTELHFRHLPSIKDIQYASKCANNASVLRVKKIIFFNFPSFASSSIKLATSFLSKKMSQCVEVIDNVKQFENVVEPKTILLEDFGGSQKLEDSIKFAKERWYSDEIQETVRKCRLNNVKWDKVPQKQGWFGWLTNNMSS